MDARALALVTLTALAAPALEGCLLGDEHRDPVHVAEVPRWSVGDWWAYDVLAENGSLHALVRFDVVAVDEAPRDGEDATSGTFYRVNVTQDGELVRVQLRDARDLDEAVWKWGEPCGPLSKGNDTLPCDSGPHELEFPLLHGKEWIAHSGGDVREEWHARAERVNTSAGDAYRVTLADTSAGGPGARCLAFAPAVGWLTEERAYADPTGVPASLRVLTGYRYANGPAGATPATDGPWTGDTARLCPTELDQPG